MSSERQQQARWPSNKPVWTIAAFLTCVTVLLILIWSRYQGLTRLQRYWLPQYALANLRAGKGYYRVLVLTEPGQRDRLLFDQDLEPGPSIVSNTTLPFRLTQETVDAGGRIAFEPKQAYENAYIKKLLQHWIFNDADLHDLFVELTVLPAWFALGTLIVGLIFGVPLDRKQATEAKYGRCVRGPRQVTAAEFNRLNHSNGIGFPTNERRTFLETILFRNGRRVCVPYRRETSHFLITADTDTGKSTLIRWLVQQLRDRGDIVIIHDPALEFTPQFYDPERGDLILSLLDQRMPYWQLSDEIEHEAEALTVAASLYPDHPRKQEFFTRGPREVFAHLLTYKPSIEELARWMCSNEEIDRRVKASEVESLIAFTAPPQRDGVLSELKMIGKLLKLLPNRQESKTVWSTRQWAENPSGWLFLTSTPATRERTVPLMSMWLDMLMLRLMHQGIANPNAPRVWFILDELASLQKLPQLCTAITEIRKSNCSIVLGFQGRSQLEARYGLEAEAMLSQPATKIFLRTSEAKSAKWISETIGDQEIEFVRETRSQGHPPDYREMKSFQLERRVEPLVMASQIQGLPSMNGYLKLDNHVVRLSFSYLDLPKLQSAMIQRTSPGLPTLREPNTPPPTPAPAVSANEQKPTIAIESPQESNEFFK